jgi:hypothetical protein
MGYMPDVVQVEIGSRVAVYWPQDNQYYEATVTRVRDKTRLLHFLEYDDGESEWIDLDQNKFRILPKGPCRQASAGALFISGRCYMSLQDG